MEQKEVKPLFILKENLDYFEGYNGQPVFIWIQHSDGSFTVKDKAGNLWKCEPNELAQIDPNTNPLYVRLNEERTQGELVVDSMFNVVSKQNGMFAICMSKHGKAKEDAANARFIQLACSNLVPLAEALNGSIKELEEELSNRECTWDAGEKGGETAARIIKLKTKIKSFKAALASIS